MTAPAARLLAAADLLDKRASGATEQVTAFGPLDYYGGMSYSEIQRDGMGGEIGHYAATLPPEAGNVLAKVLRAEAKRLKRTELMRAFGGAPLFKPEPDTLALADLLLAGGS